MSWHQSLGYGKKRQTDDFYVTPNIAVEKLLKVEKFENPIWECACGNGAISKILERHGYIVISSDLRTDDNIYGEKGIDFLYSKKDVKTIITNPPFKLFNEFILRALNLAEKVVMFGRIQALEGQERFDKIYSKNPPIRIYVFSKRVSTTKEGEGKANGTICFAWFVWEKDFKGKTVIEWI